MSSITLAQPSPSVEPDPASKARLIDVEATGLFQRGHHRAALALFKETFALVPNATTAWNIARCYEELLELAYAREAFETLYLQGFPDLPLDKQSRAQERIQELDQRIEDWRHLQYEAERLLQRKQLQQAHEQLKQAWALNHDPITQWVLLRVLDELRLTAELREATLTYSELSGVADADRRRAQALLQQHELRRRTPDTASAITPVLSPEPAPVLPLVDEPSSGLNTLQITGITLLVAGGILGIGGVGLRLSYQNAVDEIQTTEDPRRYDALLQVIEDRQPIAIGLMGGSLGALLTGAGLLWWGSQEPEETPTTSSLHLLLAPDGLAVQGAF